MFLQMSIFTNMYKKYPMIHLINIYIVFKIPYNEHINYITATIIINYILYNIVYTIL